MSITITNKNRQGVLLNLLGPVSGHQLTDNITAMTNKLQKLMPERCEGEISQNIAQILDAPSGGLSSLFALFGLAAYFVSNQKLQSDRLNKFLTWVLDQKYTQHLQQFLQINTPTVHAFATRILKATVRFESVESLTSLMDLGVELDNMLPDVMKIGDENFIKLALSKVKPTYFNKHAAVKLFHKAILGNNFQVSQTLTMKGVKVDAKVSDKTCLYLAVYNNNARAVDVVLGLGADVNTLSTSYIGLETPLARAALNRNYTIVATLLEHNADISCKVQKQDLIEWAALNYRDILPLLKERATLSDTLLPLFTFGDLIDAAIRSKACFNAFLERHRRKVSRTILEKALQQTIKLAHLEATMLLLDHGVSPDCYSLDTSPLETALELRENNIAFVELLLKHKVNVNRHGILWKVICYADSKLLQKMVKAGVNLEEQGMESLVEAANQGDIGSAALLIHLGVDIDTHGLERTPLQTAAEEGELEMVDFLLNQGADINAPAHFNDGTTALQAALGGEGTHCAWLLLHRGADLSAPPALVGGATALEAICHNWVDNDPSLCSWLMDHDAPVNRPNGKPSSALHGAIEQGWVRIIVRILEPQRNAIIDYMWCDKTLEEDETHFWEPRTPTQLAASEGKLDIVKMLIERGADVNEKPAYRFGRTALQAATSQSKPDMELVQFLLDKNADINAEAGACGGITALQGAAISGDIMLTKLLIEKGADVNGASSYVDGRYAIEGAAEHGRLDTVQLLLNAGAKGNVRHGTGFDFAIKLAKRKEFFAIVNLLEKAKISGSSV